MTIARRGFKVKVVGQANAVGPTSIEGSYLLVTDDVIDVLCQHIKCHLHIAVRAAHGSVHPCLV